MYDSCYPLYITWWDRQNEKAWKWTIVGGFAFGVPASLCKAFDNFVYHSCTVPIANQDIHRNPKCGFVKSGMHFFSQTHVEDFNAMCGVFVEDGLPAIWKIYLDVMSRKSTPQEDEELNLFADVSHVHAVYHNCSVKIFYVRFLKHLFQEDSTRIV